MPGRDAKFTLEVPLDASQIGGDAEAQKLRVLARAGDGSLTSKVVQTEPGKRASVALSFPRSPGPLQVMIGPATASESELVNLQTLSVEVPGRRWVGKPQLSIEPVVISPYHWWWWLEWCRNFVIRGKVVCADGSPVPGATVCAYDVDWWFWWTSTQQLGCATTDINGTFEIDFSWCCGWWPWWWWRERVWEIDPDLIARVSATLEQDPRIELGRVGTQPSLSVFSKLLGPGTATNGPLTATDADQLEQLRATLLAKLPSSAELSALRVWPWWPWWPWWNCDANVIFKVTQDCNAPGTVVLQEGIGQTRFNIAQSTQVTLVANELACCAQPCPTEPCIEGECIDIAEACLVRIDDVGENPPGVLPSYPPGYVYPAGYLHPTEGKATTLGAESANSDRAFGGTVRIYNANTMTNVDFYEIQYFDGTDWVALPAGAAEEFYRPWMESPVAPSKIWTSGEVQFQFTNRVIKGSKGKTVSVVESREHYEQHAPGPPGAAAFASAKAFWVGNRFLVVPIDSSKFADGMYRFRVVGWQDAGGGEVEGGEVLPVCESELENGWILAFNNRVEPDPSAILPCGSGSTHLCVTEPNTNIISVRVDGNPVDVCGTVDSGGGTLEVEFLAQDLSGNLGYYTLTAVYGDSGAVDLLALPHTLTAVSGKEVGPTYGEALAEGAVAPIWEGGTMLLTVSMAEAFEVPCCYDLELQAVSRTVVDCDLGYAYWNRSDFTIGVGVCPPESRRLLDESVQEPEVRS